MQDNYTIFENQLESVCQDHPNLKIKERFGRKYLWGTLDIFDADGNSIQDFLVEIHYKNGFPKKFPELLEIGGFIPRDVDWHKYQDDSCCVTADPIEIITCRNDISVRSFINNHAVPYLANQYYRKWYGKYKDEYSHGVLGLFEAYADIMKTPDMNKWIEYIEYTIGFKPMKTPRNAPCICGENKKFKHCHMQVFDELRAIGRDTLLKHLTEINNAIKRARQ